MKEDKILSRILNVYDESNRVINSINENVENNNLVNMNELLDRDYSHPEIDGNYLLFFNNIYNTFISKWMKKILKKVAWPILKRQVYFNTTVREILSELIKKNHASSINDRENKELFHNIEQKIEELYLLKEKVELLAEVEARIEHLTYIEQQLSEKIKQVSELEHKTEQIFTKLEADNSLISKALAIEETKIASNLWFNEAIIIGYRGKEAYWAGTNERILEKNFILLSIARLYESSQIQILDVGAAESLIAYELASLNYTVTAIDIRPIALSHPNLKFIKSDICQPVLPTASFDCVIALSTLEHIGLGWYGDEIGEGLDSKAVQQIYSLLKPEGIFLLTVPYGKKALTPVHRIYNRESLQKLVENFSIVQAVYGIRLDDFTYNVTDNESEASLKEHNPSNYLPGAVAMLVCKKVKCI